MSPAPRQGPVKSHLEQLISRHSRDTGIAADRVRRWVSTMVLLGALERAAPDHASPRFLLKGGVAIELRVRTGARATKDVDVVFGGKPGELLDALDAAFAEPYCDFAFRRGAPAEHGPHATRFDVRLTYQTRAWATVRLEISGPEHGVEEPEYVDAIKLQDFKLTGPQAIACMPLRFQIAQKLHAVSERPANRTSDRFRDLVDLLVLRKLIDDLPALRRACETTFASRATTRGRLPWRRTLSAGLRRRVRFIGPSRCRCPQLVEASEGLSDNAGCYYAPRLFESWKREVLLDPLAPRLSGTLTDTTLMAEPQLLVAQVEVAEHRLLLALRELR